MNPLKKMTQKNIVIYARRWFQRTYGNTYHSVVVYVDGEEIGKNNFEYGYGDCYLQTAHKLLQEAKIFPTTNIQLPSGAQKDFHKFRMAMRDTNKYTFIVNCVDVNRKKDL